jgi:competence protein ComEC
MKTAHSILLTLILVQKAFAQEVTVTVFDVGAGLCILGEFPSESDSTDSYYMVYDAGFSCADNIREVNPSNEVIDLMVLSHNDTDHIANADDILQEYEVKKIIWSGFERPDINQWVELNQAIDNEAGAEVINLKTDTLHIGTTYLFGQTYVTFVAGFHTPPEDWGISSSQRGEYRNAGSIVIRIVHQGRSILLTGDMIGRHDDEDEPEEHIIAAEKYVVQNRSAVSIDSDVLVAAHHGGNNASSYPLIRAVGPDYVIFSAGSHDNYAHLRTSVAQRFLNSGIEMDHMFRTDLGDDEAKPEHWENETTIEGVSDSNGDDNIAVTLTAEGVIRVNYQRED